MTTDDTTPETPSLAGRRIGFIGCGAMARALAGGLRAGGVAAGDIRASDPDPDQRARFAEATGVSASADNGDTVAASEAVVLAVKPGIVGPVLHQLGGLSDLDRPLWISIAAGVSLFQIESQLPADARVVRAMPNTPALVGAGATALCANAATRDADRALARAVFEAVGSVWAAPREDLMDAVTGLSGSGPAYVFLILEALGDAGVRQGLPRDAAYQLAFQTVLGAAQLAKESGRHPAALKDQVTSPGGTTIAGLAELERGGVRAALQAAVAAATARSRELGRG
ncbi:MAG: pyrroline-5-carboxylate reductase [Myxococcota bacterium]